MPSSFPQASAAAAPTEETLPPTPLVEGEHVLCRFKPLSASVDAVVVSLDDDYQLASSIFLRAQSTPSPPLLDTVDLTIDPDDEPGTISYPVPNGNVEVDPGSLDIAKIMFREADDNLPTTPRRPSRLKKHRRTHEVSLPPALEAYAENTYIKPAHAPAPHPITHGRVYIHFSGRDRRLDRWVPASELVRASASAVAAAASDFVDNTLVDNAVQAEFAGADTNTKSAPKLTRSRRRAYEETNPVSERELGNEALARMERAREESTKVRNISAIVLGRYHVDAWYFSPFPAEYGKADLLYLCPNCLKYMQCETEYAIHLAHCDWHAPPGLSIYHDPDRALHVYEIDGAVNMLYCQNLCLLGKLFLDHKTLYYDVAPFIFYVITIAGELAGFFSKEKPIPGSGYNLACILTLPQHQRKGVGRFLISLSYELTKREGKTGGPERPLSDLGQLSYRSYWAYSVVSFLRSRDVNTRITPKEVADATGIRQADVTATLKSINLIKLWKGETQADTAAKALDHAERRTSGPILPLRTTFLRLNLSPSDKLASASGAALPKLKRKRGRKPSAKPRSNKRGRPARHPLNCTGNQIRRISNFLRSHTSSVVHSLVNTGNGIAAPEIHALAVEIGMTVEDCQAKLLEMSASSLELKRVFSSRKEGGSTPSSDDITPMAQAIPAPYSNRLVSGKVLDEDYPDANEETIIGTGASPDEFTMSRGLTFGSADDSGFGDIPEVVAPTPRRGMNFVRHHLNPDLSPLVNRNIYGSEVPKAMCSHGLDENGLSDILGDDEVRNGAVHIPRKLEFLESTSAQVEFHETQNDKRRIHSRKHRNDVVVINSPPSSDQD